jgi:hypothetical protein
MNCTLDSLAARVRDILQTENNPTGRDKAAALLSDALRDRAFVDSLFDQDSTERKVIYEDADLGFCILAHHYTDAKAGPPHDHGLSWAIYGQARGETVMTDWALVDPASTAQPALVKKLREYALTPGHAPVYNEGAIHAPSRAGPTRLVRIEGTNLERVARKTYRPLQA